MKYFAVIAPMLDEEKSKQYRPEHLEFLEEQAQKGRVFAKGRFTDGTGGMVIYQAEGFDTVEDIVKIDPYVVNGARGYQIHEWEMTKG